LRSKVCDLEFRITTNAKKYELEARTKHFAVAVIRFVSSLEINCVTQVLNYQLLKAGTSIGANYREANRAESKKDFIHKIGIVQKEASEAQYWLELYCETSIGSSQLREKLLRESSELLAIFTSIAKTAKQNNRK